MSAQPGPEQEPGASAKNAWGKPAARSRLPLLLILVFGGLLLLGGAVWVWQSVQIGADTGAAPTIVTSPKLAVDRTEIDFGQVPFNKVVKANFKISNEGGSPLQIIGAPRVEVITGC
jgi:hypothetical protein